MRRALLGLATTDSAMSFKFEDPKRLSILPIHIGIVTVALALFTGTALSSCGMKFKTSTEYLISGNNYFKMGERYYAKAETDYREALKRDPENATAKHNLGVILNEQGRYEEAIPMLKEALKADDKDAVGHYVLASALSHKGLFDEAMVEAQKATLLDKSEPLAFRALAEAALGKGDVPTAIEAYKAIDLLDASDDEDHHKLGQLLGMSGDNDGEITEQKKAIEQNKNNLDARIALAKALHRKGAVDDAQEELQKVLEIAPTNEESKSLLDLIAKEGASGATQTKSKVKAEPDAAGSAMIEETPADHSTVAR